LIALNPSLLRSVTPPDSPFDLHLPAGTATLYEQRIASVPEAKRNAWRYHHVAENDTLASVAREFHISESELASANQLRSTDSIQGVEALVIPAAPIVAASHMLLYTARRGDTLVTIADRFGVSLTQLRRWNKMTGVKVAPGSRLHIAEPSVASSTARAHRRGAVAASSEPSSRSASRAASTKGSAHKPAVHSSKKPRTGAKSAKAAPSAAKKKHANQ
jgi:membrane-bound lytic murein transglycosylase D